MAIATEVIVEETTQEQTEEEAFQRRMTESEAAEIVGRSLSDNEVDESDEDVLSALSAGTEEMDIEVEEPTASPRVRPRRMRGRRGR